MAWQTLWWTGVTVWVGGWGLLQPASRFDEPPDDAGGGGMKDSSFLSSEEGAGDPQTTNLYVGNLAPQVIMLPDSDYARVL